MRCAVCAGGAVVVDVGAVVCGVLGAVGQSCARLSAVGAVCAMVRIHFPSLWPKAHQPEL